MHDIDPLPSPVYHPPEKDLRPVAKARGQQALKCCDCARWVICDKKETWVRCYFCKQPVERRAP
jgi:hypothetical protein